MSTESTKSENLSVPTGQGNNPQQVNAIDVENNMTHTESTIALEKLKSSCKKGAINRPEELNLSGMNFSGENLSGLDLSGYNFSNTDFTDADLTGSNLSWSILAGAIFYKAKLVQCEMLGADLTGANLNECSAELCGLSAVNLTNASLISASMPRSSLSKSSLHNADLRGADLEYASIIEADLTGANFLRTKLSKADMKQCNVKGATFEYADMRGTRLLGLKEFSKANWIGTDIRDLDLRGAHLVQRYVADENYLYEFRSQSRFHMLLYHLWRITSNCGRSLSIWTMWVIVTTLLFAGFYSVCNIDYGEYRTPFSPIYFSVVTLTTLGYGDICPASLAAQILATIQAIFGYICLGGLLSIFANKMARRAD